MSAFNQGDNYDTTGTPGLVGGSMPRLRHCRVVAFLALTVTYSTLVCIAFVNWGQGLGSRMNEQHRAVPNKKEKDVLEERRKLILGVWGTEGKESFSRVVEGREALMGIKDVVEGDREHGDRLGPGRMKLEEEKQLPWWRFPLVCIVCSQVAPNTEWLRDLGQRQHEQAVTLLKTAALFSLTTLRIILVTDTVSTFEKIRKEIGVWPLKLRQNLHLEHRPLSLPSHKDLVTQWRPCAWAKHFLPEMLEDLEAAIYLDTDTVFIGVPTDLWWLLSAVWENPKAVTALGPEGMYQREKVARPFAGKEGVNTGVMAMDFSRMRNIPTRSGPSSTRGDAKVSKEINAKENPTGTKYTTKKAVSPSPVRSWWSIVLESRDELKRINESLLRHDQDAVNFLLRQRPELFVEVTSRWNFSPSSCLDIPSKCPDCLEKGIVVLHGSDTSFYRSVDLKFNAIYGTLVKSAPDVGLAELVSELMGQLAFLDKQSKAFLCSNASSLNQAIQRGLQSATGVFLV